MSEELHKGLIRLGGKPFRRKRVSKGETWKPGRKNEPNNELGPWCFKCNTIHPWRNKKTLVARYEQDQAGLWVILWTCKRTGEVLKIEGLVRSKNRYTEE